jgi:hypothetical protein
MTKAKDKGRLPPFVPLLKDTMKTPAWRALSHGARSLYTSLKARYNVTIHNNGKLYLSERDAHKELRSGLNEIVRWYRELQHFGFIVQTRGGTIGLNGKGTAAHWRLTELGYLRDLPTRDFERWDGTPFKKTAKSSFKKTAESGYHKRTRKTESRYGKPYHSVTENRNITLLGKTVTPRKASVTENHNMVGDRGVTENHNITSYTTTYPSLRLNPCTPPTPEPLPPTMAALSEVMEPVAGCSCSDQSTCGDGKGRARRP